MGKARAAGSVLLAIAFLALAGLAIWWGLTQLSKEVAAALVTAFGAIGVVLLTRYYEQRRTARAEIREKKAAIYEAFIGFWIDTLMFKKDAASDPQAERLVAAMSDFTKGVVVYGSDNVVVSWSRYRQRFFKSDEKLDPAVDPSVLLDFETVILRIREEFDHKNRGVQRGDLLGLFLNNVGLLLQAEENRAETGE